MKEFTIDTLYEKLQKDMELCEMYKSKEDESNVNSYIVNLINHYNNKLATISFSDSLQQTIGLFENRIPDDKNQACFFFYFLLAEISKYKKELEKANHFYQKAMSYEKEMKTATLASFYQTASEFQVSRNDYEQAISLLEKSHTLHKKIQEDNSQKKIAEFQRKMDFEAKAIDSEIYQLKHVELKQANDMLSQKKENIRLINQILRHDISNNFAVVKSSIRLFSKTKDAQYIEDSISYLKKSVTLLQNMRNIESFLAENSELKIFNLKRVIQDVVQNYPHIHFSIEGNSKVIADEALASIFDNLFSNAWHHGNATDIWIAIKKRKSDCEIQVKDNGVCIPDDWKEKIFEENATFGKKAHTGLGLFIVSKTIERYGGFIFVSDNEPKGSIFTFTLKLVK